MPPASIADGLSDQAAAERLAAEGPNELPQTRRRGWLRIAGEIAREPMVQLLLAAGLVYLALGDRAEAAMLLAFVLITVSITLVQERRTERVLEALRDLSSPRALVLRGGRRLRVAGRELVRGDVILLAEGDRVPADALLLEANDLQADESLLTGEAVPVRKRAGREAEPACAPGGDDLPWVYSGAMIVRGRGLAQVSATGAHTELGRIGRALAELPEQPTPLSLQIRRLVRVFSVLGLLLSAVVVLAWGLTRGDWLGGVLAGISLAMAMLPQEFVMILTVFMAMGAHRLSGQRVLTRRAAAIGALGAATLLCTDKTGTLTHNRMRIMALVGWGEGRALSWRDTQTQAQGGPPPPADASSPELPEALRPLLGQGILACEAEAFDPMENAFHALGERFARADAPWRVPDAVLVHEYPLTPAVPAMTHVWQRPGEAQCQVAIKGAPEAVLGLCGLGPDERAAVLAQADALAAQGMRVLGVAAARAVSGAPWPADPAGFAPAFLGLVALADPLRDAVPAAVWECRAAGIDVAMITGDYPVTARAIADQAGIATAAGVLTGAQLDTLDEAQLHERLARVRVFARVSPQHKLRLIQAFRARGEVVAMTGDGVNDAPSLRAAQIGIAMGGRGTDVAREAAAIVLLDDQFDAIVRAVRLGRRIGDNLRKAMAYVLSVHVPTAGLSLLPLLFGLPVMLAPVHIAFLELVIDPVCSIVFEAEPAERDAMRRPPRDPAAPLFGLADMSAAFAQGAVVLAAVAGLAAWLLHTGLPEAQARGTGFLALVLANLGLIVFNRSFGRSPLAALARRNPALWWVTAAVGALLALVYGWPPLRELFRFAPITAQQVGMALAVAVGVTGLLFMARALGGLSPRNPGRQA